MLTANAWALSLGPAIFMVQNVVPGQPLDVKKKAKVAFTVTNDTDLNRQYSLTCEKPSLSIADWERGYEEIPDPSWFKLEQNEFFVPAKQSVEVGLIIDVPNKPEYFNCKWMLAVVLTSGKSKGIGVGLAIASRVQIETARSHDANSGGAAPIAVVPCTEVIKGKPGAAFEKSFLIKNNSGRDLECVPERLVQVYATEEFKYPRYATPGCQQLLKESWFKTAPEKFSVKSGEKHEVKIAGTIPATAKIGEKWEELVFITAPAAKPGDKGPAGRETRTFFRVIYQVEAVEAKVN
jgi:hypothetical protein